MSNNNNKRIRSDYLREYRKTLRGRFNIYLSSAKARGIEMELDFSTFSEIVSLPCSYCGDSESKIGIDRINNSIGYTRENSVACCRSCNYMKKDMSCKEFLMHVNRISDFNSIYH